MSTMTTEMPQSLSEIEERINARLTEIAAEIATRQPELDALISEQTRLHRLLDELTGSKNSQAPAAPKPATTNTGRRRGRPPGSGNRRGQALEMVKANPGITVSQLAEKMSIGTTYLYRVMPALEKSGAVKKDGGGYVAVEA